MDANQIDIDKALDLFRAFRQRRAMYVGDKTLHSLLNFLSGFEAGLSIGGTELPIHQALENRGWYFTSRGGIDLMKEKGLTEEEQCIETLDIYLEAFRLLQEGRSDA